MPTARSLKLRFAMSRRRAAGRRILFLIPVAAAVACSDGPSTAPAATRAPVAPALDRIGVATPPKTETFVYDGRARTQSFGDGHSVRFDAQSVCDPSSSAYGPDTWDQPCAPATGPITFTVTSWRDAAGRPQVAFSPDVRFVPGTTEILYLNDNPGAGQKAVIQWCSPLVNGCVNEAATDPTLTTWIAGGSVARRIKHFSGYNVIFGVDDGSSSGM
jgi:hypothetical protein